MMTKNISCYPKTTSELDIDKMEEAIQDYWECNETFQKSIRGDQEFVFYDGPPFANGLPHYGHLLTGCLKDLYARYKTMRGYKVERTFGWDCHGLPAELETEKELGISGGQAINELGIEKFNAKCRESVMKYADQWKRYVTRQGRWVNFQNGYKTMDIKFMESVLWAFKKLYTSGLIYQSSRVLPYSWKCETPVSNFETKIDNCYREKTSKTVVASITLTSMPETLIGRAEECRLLIWTTTPWTLPCNQALAIGKAVEYTAFINNDKNGKLIAWIASTKYIEANYAEKWKDGIYIPVHAAELVRKTYDPLFRYFVNKPDFFKIFEAGFVSAAEGTGIVHIAPGFGEDDFDLCSEHKMEVMCPVDKKGCFTDIISDFEGINVLESNDKVIAMLKSTGAWICTGQHTHSYPHCWRTDTPLIYKAVDSWYLDVEKIKDRMVVLNQQVNWVPEHIKTGQFGKWLEGAKNWSISRNRFWGTPIPVWKSDNPKYPRIDVYGSLEELQRDFMVQITDLHRPFIDQLERPNPDDPTGQSMMRRVEEVLDCWFESGSMPYGQFHYPFENKEWFEAHFPADFITEYVSQTRGWFYTLFVLSTALFDRPPFKNCLCHGVVLDIKKQKLSKRLNNYPDPLKMMHKYGADAMRFLMVSSAVCTGGSLLLDQEGIMLRDTARMVIKPLWSAYHFFCINANADGTKAIRASINSPCLRDLDKYIMHKCNESIAAIVDFMDKYDSISACSVIMKLIDILNNWYIRRSRPRFWRREQDVDKLAAYNTLHTVLCQICLGIAPFLPMLAEHMWQGLVGEGSVHLQRLEVHLNYDIDLIQKMDTVRAICSAGYAIRNKQGIRARQILPRLTIYAYDASITSPIERYFNLIQEEVNVKELHIEYTLAENSQLKIKPDFQKLSAKISKEIPQIVSALNSGQYKLKCNGSIEITELGLELKANEYSKHFVIRDDAFAEQVGDLNLVVTLDTNITHELRIEGKVRDIIRFIQQSRKELGLNISDSIYTTIYTTDPLDLEAIDRFGPEIKEQTLSLEILVDTSNSKKPMFSFDDVGISIRTPGETIS